MLSLGLAAVFLLVTHFISSTPVRPAVVDKIGEKAWLGAYSLVSFVAFAWLIFAWRAAPTIWLFSPSVGARHALLALMPVPAILVVGAIISPNPAMVMRDRLLDREPTGILRITRHPMLWGIGLWALLHMWANPDLASWLLFGSLAILSFGGTVLQDYKKRRDIGEAWVQWEKVTSNVPFRAILSGRTALKFDGGLGEQLVVGLVLYAAALRIHPLIAGVGVLPG